MLNVQRSIGIQAAPDKIWQVLTHTRFIRQWDEVPETFTQEVISKGTVIEWEGFSKMTVTEFVVGRKLKFSLFLPKVSLPEEAYDVSYIYELAAEDNRTILNITIGDFSPLPGAENYYQASLDFAETSGEKIRGLAENL